MDYNILGGSILESPYFGKLPLNDGGAPESGDSPMKCPSGFTP